jgi:hypothetical protein
MGWNYNLTIKDKFAFEDERRDAARKEWQAQFPKTI